MIPTHEFSERIRKDIQVTELGALMTYDSSEPHRHQYFELFVFIKGGGVHVIDFEEFPIHDHSIHIVAPGRVHQVRRALDSHGFVLLFDMDVLGTHHLIAEFLLNHTCYTLQEHSPVYVFEGEEQVLLTEIANRIRNDYQSANAHRNEFILHNLALLCIQCLRKEDGLHPAPLTAQGMLYFQFRRLLNSRFRELKKVKEYAALLHVSEKQLNESVKLQTGSSASIVIYKQVILEARRLLNLGLSAKEVAYELAFDDPAHFSKFFKSQTQLSPSDFQKIHV